MGRWTSNVIRGATDHETHGSDRFTVFESQIGFFLDQQTNKQKWGRGNGLKQKLLCFPLIS